MGIVIPDGTLRTKGGKIRDDFHLQFYKSTDKLWAISDYDRREYEPDYCKKHENEISI